MRRERLLVDRGRPRTASGSQEGLPGRPGESSGRPGKASRWSAKRLRMEPVSRADDYRNFSINCNYNHRTRTCLPRRDVSRGPCCRATLQRAFGSPEINHTPLASVTVHGTLSLSLLLLLPPWTWVAYEYVHWTPRNTRTPAKHCITTPSTTGQLTCRRIPPQKEMAPPRGAL